MRYRLTAAPFHPDNRTNLRSPWPDATSPITCSSWSGWLKHLLLSGVARNRSFIAKAVLLKSTTRALRERFGQRHGVIRSVCAAGRIRALAEAISCLLADTINGQCCCFGSNVRKRRCSIQPSPSASVDAHARARNGPRSRSSGAPAMTLTKMTTGCASASATPRRSGILDRLQAAYRRGRLGFRSVVS